MRYATYGQQRPERPEAIVDAELTGRLVAWPLLDTDLPRACDMACAMVLTTASQVTPEQRPAIWGVGWATVTYDLGDRDLSGFAALTAAARMALGDTPATRFDVVEIQEITRWPRVGAAVSPGLAPPGGGAAAAIAGSVNPSGGNLFASPGNAAGFPRILQAARQVRGAAGPIQVHPRPRTGLAAALHGFAGQARRWWHSAPIRKRWRDAAGGNHRRRPDCVPEDPDRRDLSRACAGRRAAGPLRCRDDHG